MADTVRLTPEQQEAISETNRNLQIIACAGSGKTEVITRRIANILESKPEITPENIVAFTFTEKAAASMKTRIARALSGRPEIDVNKMYIGTIHSFCYHLLNRYTEQFCEYKILDTVKSYLFVSRYCGECGMSNLKLEPYPRNVNLFLQCIDKMIDDYDNAGTWTQEQRDVLGRYIDCLYGHGYIDFSLMIFETLRQIEENPKVRSYLSGIKYLVVDEYQDVNDLQEKLIMQIAKAGANTCVVGDDDQTIYQFRGSNADNMISFSERYPNVHQVRLEKNFRCVPGVVDIADCVIGHNNNRITKKMVSGAEAEQTELSAIRYPGKEEEFEGIAQKILKLHENGLPYREIAILVRKGKHIVSASKTLEQAGIPVETDSAESFFQGEYFERFVSTLQILADVDKAKLFECWKDIVDGTVFNMGFKFLRSCARGGNLKLSEIIHGFCDKISFLREDAEDIETRRMDLEGIGKILEDEWKLFYVAVTRAKKNLYITYELSSQPVSCFVAEAAESHHLKINRDDLAYNPRADVSDAAPVYGFDYENKSSEPNPEWEEERRQKQEYWAAIKYARSQLYDYYGTACHFCPGAHGDLIRIKSMSPDEILTEASRNGLI